MLIIMKKQVKNGLTVLLVDDEWLVLGAMREILRAQGYTVLEANRGEDALRICEEHEGPIDLLLTDVVMPEMNGRELASRVSEARPGIKVIYMSGYTEDTLIQHGVRTNEIAFVRKPFSILALEAKLREVLGASNSNGANSAWMAA
jgi:two-component system, cell cycle sensor histidine kinase and response regulator CckA